MIEHIERYRNLEYGLSERTDVLDGTSWMQSFKWSQLEKIAAYMDVYDIPDNTQIFLEGSKETDFCLLVAGRVRILKKSADGKTHEIAILGKGNALGEMSLVDGAPRSASAVMKGDGRIIVMSEYNYNRLCEEEPSIALALVTNIARLLSLKLRRTSGMLTDEL